MQNYKHLLINCFLFTHDDSRGILISYSSYKGASQKLIEVWVSYLKSFYNIQDNLKGFLIFIAGPYNLASQIFIYDIAISNNYHYHFFYLHILLSPNAAFIVELIIVVNIEQSRLSQLRQTTILKWFTELVRFDPFTKMSIKFVFSVILILIPPSLSQLECFKCEERRDTNGTLISGNCMSDLTNAEIKVVNCLYKCSILHASDRKWHELKIRKWCHFKYI